MNRGELREQLAFVLNFNDGQTDQDFSSTRLNDLLNMANRIEVRLGMSHGRREFFLEQQTFTWEEDATTLAIPEFLVGKVITGLYDVTGDDIGRELVFSKHGQGSSDIFYLNRSTLQWGTSGPGSDRTIRAYYLATPEKLGNDNDTPLLVPPDLHDLLVWSAAVLARTVGDEVPPQAWQMQRDELRLEYWKHVATGNPRDSVAQITPNSADFVDESGYY